MASTRAERELVEAVCGVYGGWILWRTEEIRRGNRHVNEAIVFFTRSGPTPLPLHLFSLTHIWQWKQMCVHDFRSTRRLPHKRLSPLPPLFTSHPTLSANLLWPLTFCARKLENGKDLKLAILDVAGWRCEKKNKKKPRGLLRDSQAEEEKNDGDGVGGGSFIFLSVDLNVWKKAWRTWERRKPKPTHLYLDWKFSFSLTQIT